MNRGTWIGAALLAMLAGVGGSAVGCTAVVGVGDYAVGSGDASSGDDGASGSSSGASSSGGSSSGASSSSSSSGGTVLTDAGGLLGDPCRTSSDCVHGTCQGSWCTESCTSNAACGSNSQGQPNYCVTNASGSGKSCVPGCATNADCAPYAGSTCTQITGGAAFYCAPRPGSDSGSLGVIGDPCATDSQCMVGTCSNATWCSQSCTSSTDTSCGSNTNQVPNHCVLDAANNYICFPGCSTNADCTAFSGTTCQPITTGGSTRICAGTNGAVGDPCSTSASSPWSSCAAPDGGAGPTCSNDIWCSQSCTTDASCGENTAGQASFCVQASGGSNICFPGCTQFADCATYPGTFCQPIYGSTRGFVCAASGGEIGDPCASDADCTTGTCLGNWCTQSCASATDTSCGTNSEGDTNRCVFNTQTSRYQCFPGCKASSDCTPYGGATCMTITGVPGTVCSFP